MATSLFNMVQPRNRLWSRAQSEAADDTAIPCDRRGLHPKEDERGVVHVKGESTESELDEEEEEDDVIQLGDSEDDARGSYSQVCGSSLFG